MPPLDLKTESSPACAVEWPRWSGEIERAQASHRAARVGSVDALAISSRQFLARLEIAVTLSKQRSDHDSNRHFWTGLSYNVAARSDPFNSLVAKMEIKESLGGVSFAVRVTPRASRDAIEGEHT